MILDLQKFIRREEPYWQELDTLIRSWEIGSDLSKSIVAARRFNYLYQRACTALNQLTTFSSNEEVRRYLEDLVARAYAEIHEVRRSRTTFNPLRWFFQTFPRTFRHYGRVFGVVVAITVAGMLFGGLAVALDEDAKEVLMPFSHLSGDPSERVAREESSDGRRLEGNKSAFSAHLMTHNIRVSIFALALGLTFGIGTIIVLFYNGVILGAVCIDYIRAGEGIFLTGWLLPHGATEIPSILIAGQAGLILAQALIGTGSRQTRRQRLRAVAPDLTTLIGGVALLLVYSGVVEAFLSQYHEPVIPYWVKIGFGTIEVALLTLFLLFSGRFAKSHA
jgi:uncharacterized membrane protein SpoIIM required for sporulation